jgi:hypothetical protein
MKEKNKKERRSTWTRALISRAGLLPKELIIYREDEHEELVEEYEREIKVGSLKSESLS